MQKQRQLGSLVPSVPRMLSTPARTVRTDSILDTNLGREVRNLSLLKLQEKYKEAKYKVTIKSANTFHSEK